MLFQSIDEISEHLPVVKSLDFDQIKPMIKQAERKFITGVAGDELLEYLQNLYDGNEIEDATKTKKLLDLIQEAIANFAFFLYIPHVQVTITDGGIKVISNENEKPADWKQVRDIRREYLKNGYEALDAALAFLIKEKSTFTTWANSATYSSLFELFINTAKEFSDIYNINNSYRTFLALRPSIRRAEEKFILPRITTALNDKLKAAIKAQDLTSLSDTEKTALKYIKKVVVHHSIAMMDITVNIQSDGIYAYDYSLMSENIPQVTLEQIAMIKNQRCKDGDEALKELSDLLDTPAEETTNDTKIYGAF